MCDWMDTYKTDTERLKTGKNKKQSKNVEDLSLWTKLIYEMNRKRIRIEGERNEYAWLDGNVENICRAFENEGKMKQG